MLDVCLLGSGGMMPLPYRWLTALMTRYNGSQLLIDCGEGTQIALKEKGWSFKPIDVICFTHYHGDHISGLPGAKAMRQAIEIVMSGEDFESAAREKKELSEALSLWKYHTN